MRTLVDVGWLNPVVPTLDMIILAISGGGERSAAQLGQLLDSAGFRIESVHETPGALRVVEAVAVS